MQLLAGVQLLTKHTGRRWTQVISIFKKYIKSVVACMIVCEYIKIDIKNSNFLGRLRAVCQLETGRNILQSKIETGVAKGICVISKI